MIEHYALTPERLLDELLASPVFRRPRHSLVKRGIKAFFEADYAVAVHLLVPEVESAIREAARLNGAVLQKANRRGGYDLRNLNDLLVDEFVESFLTENVSTYLRNVLSDPKGLNLRNRLCHGMLEAKDAEGFAARRVFHVVVLLGLFSTPTTREMDTSK